VLAVLSTLIFSAPLLATPPQYDIVLLAISSNVRTYTTVDALNNNGDVVGTFNGYLGEQEAFYIQHSSGSLVSLRPIGEPPGDYPGGFDAALGINDGGKIVGTSTTATDSYPGVAAAWYLTGAMEEIGPFPNGKALSAVAVANNGLAVGVGFINDRQANRPVVYRWSNHSMSNLGALPGSTDSRPTAISPAGAYVVGDAYLPAIADSHGFLVNSGGGPMRDLGTLLPSAINDAGTIAGKTKTKVIDRSGNCCAYHAAIAIQSVVKDLGNLAGIPAWESNAEGINSHGEVVGSSDSNVGGSPAPRAFIYVDGSLNNLQFFVPNRDPNLRLTDALAINCNGWVLATGYLAQPNLPPGAMPDFSTQYYLLIPRQPLRADCPRPH
jgi:probable HAF family extracellular repeat protein